MPSISINFSDSARRSKRIFIPLEVNKVSIYVCGPTVYGRAHLGNLRSAIVFDLLQRFMRICFPEIVFVRNITDIDDKIIAAAKARHCSFRELSEEMLALYHLDIKALGCISPQYEPRATQHIAEMIGIIQDLIARGHAYYKDGHVLFSARSYPEYGRFSGRSLEEMLAGARVEVAPYKADPQDFVLWKPSSHEDAEFAFPSPWGQGRPGWHIECSAMSMHYLGANFDIHGGGMDLTFPHHENEIAQSCCAKPGSEYARYWLHNGLLTINGEKMSKSLGNILTLEHMVDNPLFCLVFRYFCFTAHYRKAMDYNAKILADCWAAIQRIARAFVNVANYLGGDLPEILGWRHTMLAIGAVERGEYTVFAEYLRNDWGIGYENGELILEKPYMPIFIQFLADDLNSSALLGAMQSMARALLHLENRDKSSIVRDFLDLFDACYLLGLNIWENSEKILEAIDYTVDRLPEKLATVPANIVAKAEARLAAKRSKNWAEADALRAEIAAAGYTVRDLPDGSYVVERSS